MKVRRTAVRAGSLQLKLTLHVVMVGSTLLAVGAWLLVNPISGPPDRLVLEPATWSLLNRLLGAVVAGNVLGYLFLLAFVFRPLRRLRTTLERRLHGDKAVRLPDSGKDAVSGLTQSLNRTIQALADSESYLQAIVDAAADGIIICTEQGVVRSFNHA